MNESKGYDEVAPFGEADYVAIAEQFSAHVLSTFGWVGGCREVDLTEWFTVHFPVRRWLRLFNENHPFDLRRQEHAFRWRQRRREWYLMFTGRDRKSPRDTLDFCARARL